MHCIYNLSLNRFYVVVTLNLFKFNLLRAFLEDDLLCYKNENHNKGVASGHFVLQQCRHISVILNSIQ